VLASANHFLLDAAGGLAVLGLGLLGTAGKQRRPCDRHRGAAARQDPAGRGAPPMSTVTITARPTAGAGPAGAPRTAFVLAGGTALGDVQAGMVHALYERGIVPDLLAGTSAAGRHLGWGPERRVPRLPAADGGHRRRFGGHLARAAAQRHPPAPPAHGRGLGTVRPRISAKP